MPRRKRNVPVASVFEPGPEPALKKQPRYGSEPWKPGEIPRERGVQMITGRLDEKRMPHGEFLGVQKPDNAGRGRP